MLNAQMQNSELGNVMQNAQQRSMSNSADPLDRFMASVQPTIDAVRKRIAELNAAHTTQRASILNRTSDELAKLDKDHGEAVCSLMSTLERLVEFRG